MSLDSDNFADTDELPQEPEGTNEVLVTNGRCELNPPSQMTIRILRLFGDVIRDWQQRKDDDMTRLLVFTVVALGMGLTPVLAADTSSPTTPPTESNVPPDASKAATNPPSGSADTSGGATEQSSSPPSAGSTMGKMGEESSSPPDSASTSGKMGAPADNPTPNPTAPSSGD